MRRLIHPTTAFIAQILREDGWLLEYERTIALCAIPTLATIDPQGNITWARVNPRPSLSVEEIMRSAHNVVDITLARSKELWLKRGREPKRHTKKLARYGLKARKPRHFP